MIEAHRGIIRFAYPCLLSVVLDRVVAEKLVESS